MVLQKPLEQADRLPPPRTLILDFTLTHTRYGSSHVNTTGQLTNTRRSDGAPELDGALREVARKKILHYRQLYLNRPDPIAFLPAAADTTGRVYDDFSRLLFLHAHREASALANEIPEESGQFRFLRAARYANIKGSVGLILAKASAMRISIPLDLSSRPFIPLAEYHFKQQLLIQVARHVNCNKKQQLKKLEGKVRGLVVHRTQQTGRRTIAGRPRARSARIYFNRNEDTGPQTPCSRRASLQKSSQSCFLLLSKVLSFSEEKEK